MSLTTSAQTHVSTEPSPRVALLEEFTGIFCGNCPDGHEMSRLLQLAHPGMIIPVNIHAGHFAEVEPGYPSIYYDFNTPQGTIIHDYFGANSYPCAVMNRTMFNGQAQYCIGRGSWGNCEKTVNTETAPVNIWMDATYNKDTRTYEIDIEAYFISEVLNPKLIVEVLQNDICGYQSGGGVVDSYWHQHVFREIITDTWGDTMADYDLNTPITRHFTYVLPEKIQNVPTDPAHMEFVAFISEGDTNITTGNTGVTVLNATSCHPAIPGVDEPNDVRVYQPLVEVEANKGWGYNFFPVVLMNKTSKPLTSAEFEVLLNKNTLESSWTGEIAPYSQVTVQVPIPEGLTQLDEGQNRWRVDIVKANGEPVSTPTFISGNFRQYKEYPNKLKFEVRTDKDAADNTFTIRDESGAVVEEFGPYTDGEVHEETREVELEPGKIYCLEITDAWGNGVKNPRGQVIIRNMEGGLVNQFKEIDGYGLRGFFRTSDNSGVNGIASENIEIAVTESEVAAPGACIAVYSASGMQAAVGFDSVNILALAPGAYIVKAEAEGKVRTCKFMK